MAFTRDFVLKAGLPEESVDEVMKEHGIAVQRAKDTIRAAAEGDGKEQGAELERLKKEIAQKDNQISKLQAGIKSVKLSSKIETALLKAGARNLTACKALIDEGTISIDKNGNLKGFDEQLKALTTDDDTSFLFKQDESKQADDGEKSDDGKGAETQGTEAEKKGSGYKPKGGENPEVKGIGAQIAAEKAEAAKSESAESSLWA